jgi:hypothetical protein
MSLPSFGWHDLERRAAVQSRAGVNSTNGTFSKMVQLCLNRAGAAGSVGDSGIGERGLPTDIVLV